MKDNYTSSRWREGENYLSGTVEGNSLVVSLFSRNCSEEFSC